MSYTTDSDIPIHDFICRQGSTFSRTLTWRDENSTLIDLTGYTARMKVKKSLNSTSNILSLTSASGITLGGAAGTIAILISAADTANITPDIYQHDLEVESAGGVVTTLIAGRFIVKGEVTT